ncbi:MULTISPECIES: excalibur calcium-binding domain-containing protein [Bacillus]|uniref:excalibur calcium-binding domain-containing protein n=1 Tax=Bacillus TaxID=1386 RepID=UPI0011A51F36|nr:MULTISPECIES: excalibur calcium-binding domain-containing protein [Bacillus]QRY36094.1 excalibur calcium-binding domain-containing protein [Bacillus sp. PDNC022]UQZ91815.1 calcium-binding protein [Bacillus safensis]UXO88548.1 excalibur calcium-binding domain-containing protein [Bacillus safensis]
MLKKIMVAVLSLGLLLSFTQVDTHTADAKTVKSYKNCKALNKVYKGGVAKSKNTKNKGGKTKYKPYASKALYLKNKHLDRDKDGIACER